MPTTRMRAVLTAEQKLDLSGATTAGIQYRIAASRAERAAAFRLVYHSYLRAGLGEPNPYEMRITPYHLLPSTQVFIAVLQGEVISTVSLIADGKLGLPIESVYAREVALRREQGLFVGEASCLADRRARFQRLFPVFLKLCRLMVQCARRQGLDHLLVAVHPKHARFYRRFMDFEQIGQAAAYPSVRNHPAVALCLDFARIDRERPENYDTFFGEPLPEQQLRPRPISAADCEYFRPMVAPSFDLGPLGDAPGPPTGSKGQPSTGAA